MSVYVDNMRRYAQVGHIRGHWSHMFADTSDELHAMAATLGLRREWVQHEGTHREHYDVTDLKRTAAIHYGAQQISYPRGTAELLARKRDAESEQRTGGTA